MKNSCRHFGRCGGCQILDKEYSAQLVIKHARLCGLFCSWKNCVVPPLIGASGPFYYRHKVQLPFAPGKNPGAPVALGCYATGSHEVVDQRECLVQDRELSAIAWTLRDWAASVGLTAYNEKTGRGFLRHVLLRKGAGTGDVLVGLVTNGDRPDGTRFLANKILEMIGKNELTKSAKIAGIIQSVNTRKTNVVLGEREIGWWGRTFIKEKLGPLSFHVGISTFFQVNPFQTPVLYDTVKQQIPEGAKVLDVYCGVGSIALWIADRAVSVLGIEENIASVKAAKAAAHANRIGNVRFVAGDAALILSQKASNGFDTAIVDPPRKGLDPGAVSALRTAKLKRLIYVSCNPESLVRDIQLLEPVLRLRSVQGVDMFPHTDHLESVAVLEG